MVAEGGLVTNGGMSLLMIGAAGDAVLSCMQEKLAVKGSIVYPE